MIYAVLGFIAALFAWIAYVARKARKSGETAEKYKSATEVLNDAKKAADTVNRLNDDLAGKLRKKYPRVKLLPRDPP